MTGLRHKKIGWKSALAIVIANMVGTGVFTTLGFQLEVVQNTWSILILWIVGGVIAMLGAFSYAEIGTHLPKSGGEYHFLSNTMHPFLGYLSGWVSLTVGFAAPIALAAMGMGAYLSKFIGLPPNLIAILSIVLISLIHSNNLQRSSLFQGIFTSLKIGLLLIMVIAGFWHSNTYHALEWSPSWKGEVLMPAYAVALIYVTYAYSGWNAAAYIVGEIRKPTRNLPIALIGGTVLVAALYVLLQLAFLRQAPIEAMVSKVEVGQVAAEYMFGAKAAKWVSFAIALLLVSSISAMIWVGPRISRAMAADYRIWGFLRQDNDFGVPVRAVWFQSAISILLIVTGTFEQVLLYSGFILQLFTTITIASLFILRRRNKDGDYFRSPFYPYIQVLFIVVSLWMMLYMMWDKPWESMLGGINLVIGAITFYISKFLDKPKYASEEHQSF